MQYDSVKYNKHHRAIEKQAIVFLPWKLGNVMEDTIFNLDLERWVEVSQAENVMNVFF